MHMPRLTEGGREHLERALQTDETEEKNFHIRQVLQAYGVDDIPDEYDPELSRLSD